MARPTKRTPQREQAILNALRLGNTRTAAAAFAEVDRVSLWRWVESDAAFRNAVEKAEADAEFRFVSQVASAAADGTWTAAAWWLERRRPNEYARRDRVDSRVEVSGPGGGPIETLQSLSDHERRALRDAIEAHLAQEDKARS